MGKQKEAAPLQAVLSDEEWLGRYDQHITDSSDFQGSYSKKVGKEDALAWRDLGHRHTPEAAAVEEMESWDHAGITMDDEDGERLCALSRLYSKAPMLHGYTTPDLVIGGIPVMLSSAEVHHDIGLCDKGRG